MTDHRIESRFRSRGQFTLLANQGEPISAKLLDASPSGLGVEASVELPSGTAVRVHCAGIEVAEGTVQHCRPSGGRFVIGIALSPPDDLPAL